MYFKGIELANGFRELTDGREQQQRFEQDNRKRAERGLPQQPIDYNLLAALQHGMPECSGVALGVDRSVMLALGAESLSDVLAFRSGSPDVSGGKKRAGICRLFIARTAYRPRRRAWCSAPA